MWYHTKSEARIRPRSGDAGRTLIKTYSSRVEKPKGDPGAPGEFSYRQGPKNASIIEVAPTTVRD